MTKYERAEMYRDFLAEEGFSPEIDSDGDVTFKFEGMYHYIAFDPEDEAFFRLVFSPFWKIESEEERAMVLAAACEATAKVKVAKIFPFGEDVLGTVEMFLPGQEDFKPVLRRCLETLSMAVREFAVLMKQSEKRIFTIDEDVDISA